MVWRSDQWVRWFIVWELGEDNRVVFVKGVQVVSGKGTRTVVGVAS